MDLKEINILGSNLSSQHWYYRAKSKAVLALIQSLAPRIVLDIGAGSSIFSKLLLERTNIIKAVCIDSSYLHECTELYHNKPIEYLKFCELVDADLILMLDILEHIPDDAGFLRDYISKSRSGTFFLVSVPAFSFIWSAHDSFLGHERRYTLKQLEQLLISNGLTVMRGSYYFSAIFPIAALVRLVKRLFRQNSPPRSDLKPASYLLNEALAAICSAEIHFLPYNRLFGLTAFCLARKP